MLLADTRHLLSCFSGILDDVRSDRLLATLLLLQSHGRLPAPEIARRLEVSRRTVSRDVEALSAAGVPVYCERGRNGGVALLEGYRTDVTGMTDEELRALVALGSSADGGALGSSLASASRKLLAALPDARRAGVDRARRRLLVEHQGWRRAPEELPALPALDAALVADERVRLQYATGDAAHATVAHRRPVRPGQQGRHLVPRRGPPWPAEDVPRQPGAGRGRHRDARAAARRARPRRGVDRAARAPRDADRRGRGPAPRRPGVGADPAPRPPGRARRSVAHRGRRPRRAGDPRGPVPVAHRRPGRPAGLRRGGRDPGAGGPARGDGRRRGAGGGDVHAITTLDPESSLPNVLGAD